MLILFSKNDTAILSGRKPSGMTWQAEGHTSNGREEVLLVLAALLTQQLLLAGVELLLPPVHVRQRIQPIRLGGEGQA